MKSDIGQDNVVEFPKKINSALWAGTIFFGGVVICLGLIILVIGTWLEHR